jgi:hypothetical protein
MGDSQPRKYSQNTSSSTRSKDYRDAAKIGMKKRRRREAENP